jgi:iron complex outermembrane recepter protein
MNTAPALRRWRMLYAYTAVWFTACLSVLAQGTGTIQGRVFNPVSKEYVRNAEVRLDGTAQVTYTENDGSFSFNNVPAGPASISVTYTGYNPVKESFTVTPGQSAVREINLISSEAPTVNKEGVVQLQAFTVASEREGNAKAIQAQRRDMNIITSVSSDLFGDVADGNVGEFLKYLPGIDLDYVESEPRGPRIGGMDGQYVGVAFDGMRTASADANRGGDAASRATSFEGFSISSIESIEVNLTSSAENDADTPAGNINMRTKRAFDRKGRQFTYNLSGNFNSEEFTLHQTDGPRDKMSHKWKPNYIFSYAESFFNQRFGLLLSANHSFSYTEQIRNTNTYSGDGSRDSVNPRPNVTRVIDFGDGPKFIQKDALLLTADWKVTRRLVVSLNAVYSYFDGEFWNRSFTFNAANDNANINNGRPSIRGDGITTIIADRTTASNFANLTNGGGGAAKLVYTRQYAPRFEYKLNSLVVDGALAFSRSLNNYESLERGFSKDEGGSIASGFIATRPNAQSWEWTIRQTSGPDWFDLKNYTGGTRVTNDDRTWMTEKWTGNLNARYVLPFIQRFPTTIKFGGKWDEETRKNHDHGAASVWSYIGPGGNTVTYNPATETYSVATQGSWANLGPEFVSPNPFELGKTNAWAGGGIYNINGQLGRPPRPSRNAMSDLFHAHPELFVNTMSVDNYYNSYIVNEKNLRQTITAGYGQSDTRVTRKLLVRFGLRWEETKNEITEFDPLNRKQMLLSPYASQFASVNAARATSISGLRYQYMSQPQVTRHSRYTNLFPSVSFKYNILPNFEWQGGYNKSIGRPSINSIAGLWVVDEQNQRVSAPNPDLEPEHHQKYLTRLGYYFQGRSPGSLTLTVSKTEFTNTLASYDFNASDFGNDDPDFENYTFRSNRNISDRIVTTKNMSFSYRQTMGFLPSEYLRGITFFANYDRTYVTASGNGSGPQIRRSNVTPHRIASGVSYRFRKFSSSFNAIWGADRPESGTYGRYIGESTKFDGTLGYDVGRHLSFFVQARNITNVKDGYYQSPPGAREGQQGALRVMEEYGSNWIFGVKGVF